jgi:FkbM family methyltransferase
MTPIHGIQRTIAAAAYGDTSGLFDRAAGAYEGLVIAGASGFVAEHTMAGLERLGTPPVALVDNNPARWGGTFHDVVVLPAAEAIRRHPNAVYVAAVFTHTPLRQQLLMLGASRVVSYAPLFHKYPGTFLPYFAVDDPAAIAAQADAVQRAASIWADEESASLYAAILQWFVTLDSDAVPRPLPASATYFPDVLLLRDDEVFVDCGAFDGDTALTYAAACGGRYGSIIALEPDPGTFTRLTARVATLERTVAMNAAVGARRGSLPFVANGALSSHAVTAGAQGLAAGGPLIDVEVVTLDGLAPRPTYVKMDIEGFEREALAGGRGLLSGGDTAFAVTLYHRMSDLWQLPLFIHECAPNLRLYLRHYAEDWAETTCYAVPANRIRDAGRHFQA